MNNPAKRILCYLPILIVLMLAVVALTPTAQAAQQTQTPKLNTPVNTSSGVQLSWRSVPNAVKYRVLVKKSNSAQWKKIIDTKKTSVIHKAAKDGVKYTYTVRCIFKKGKLGSIDRTGKSITFVKPPRIKSVTNSSSGVKISWTAPKTASGYRIYYRTTGNWKALATTSSPSYLHVSAHDGTAYSFKVRCINQKDRPVSGFGNIKRITCKRSSSPLTNSALAYEIYTAIGRSYIRPAKPTSLVTRRSAAEILFTALKYPRRYLISLSDSTNAAMRTVTSYGYFIPDGKDRVFPSRLLTATEHTKILTDIYRYTKLKGKRALAFGDSIMYGCGNHQYSDCRLIAEKYGMTYTSYALNGATFGTCDNGRIHIVDRIKKAYSAKKKADIIFLNGATNDIKLVKAGNTPDTFDPQHPEQSTFALGFETAMQLIRQYWGSTPVIYVRAHNISGCPDNLEIPMGEYGIGIAEKYGAATVDVFSGSAFNTSDQLMRDRYTRYNPQAGNHDGTHPTGLGYTTFYMPLVTQKLLFTPTLQRPSCNRDGVMVSWSGVGKSPKYRVFIHNGKSWTKLADTTSTSYIHRTAVSGKKYTYTVRCVSNNGKYYLSGFEKYGRSVTYVASPKVTLSNRYNKSIRLSWDKVGGASRYRVFLKTDSGLKTLYDVAGTAVTYTGCISGREYSFAVRCLTADRKYYLGAQSAVVSIRYFDVPFITSFSDLSEGVKVSWAAKEGATHYRVYVRDVGSEWRYLADTSDTFFINTEATPDVFQQYAVRCFDSYEKNISDFPASALAHQYIRPEVPSENNSAD